MSEALDPAIAARLKRTDGLVAAIVLSDETGEVHMLAWMNDEALARTLTSGRATYFSRSRGEIWVKGETSGNRQLGRSVALDCDGDALLVRVVQEGPAGHTGSSTCFTDRDRPLATAPPSRYAPSQAVAWLRRHATVPEPPIRDHCRP